MLHTHTRTHTLGKLTTLQLIVITIPVAIAEARQFQAGAVVAFALKVATLGRNGIVTCTERGVGESGVVLAEI